LVSFGRCTRHGEQLVDHCGGLIAALSRWLERRLKSIRVMRVAPVQATRSPRKLSSYCFGGGLVLEKL